MMKPYPTYRQREVLQFLISGDWIPRLKLIAVGDRLLGNLVQAGWIERSPDVKTGDLYRITEACGGEEKSLSLPRPSVNPWSPDHHQGWRRMLSFPS